MNLLFITSAYPPEVRSSSLLIRDLAESFASEGNNVSVLTAYPQFNLTEKDHATYSQTYGFFEKTENGVRVMRVPSANIHNSGPVQRAIASFIVPLKLIWYGLGLKKVDFIIMYSPPLTLAFAAIALKWRFGAKFILNVQDLFPQNMIDVGLLKNPFVIWISRSIERFVYKNADVITCHSESNLQILRKMCGPQKKIHVVENWIDHTPYLSSPDVQIRKKTDTEGKFVAFFAGVMGYTQGLDVVIDAAKAIGKKTDQIVFLLVGDGVEKKRLLSLSNGSHNIRFLPFVSLDEYPKWVATFDVGLVTLDPKMKTPVVPSKVLGYMAGGKPFVASVNKESDLRGIVERSKGGIMAEPGDPHSLADAIWSLYQDRELYEKMGRSAQAYCTRYLSRESGVRAYEEILKSQVNNI